MAMAMGIDNRNFGPIADLENSANWIPFDDPEGTSWSGQFDVENGKMGAFQPMTEQEGLWGASDWPTFESVGDSDLTLGMAPSLGSRSGSITLDGFEDEMEVKIEPVEPAKSSPSPKRRRAASKKQIIDHSSEDDALKSRRRPRASPKSTPKSTPSTPLEAITPKVLTRISLDTYSLPPSQLSTTQHAHVVSLILSRRQANRESAKKSRERKQEEVERLEGRVVELEGENEGLRRRVRELEGLVKRRK
jgi:hypothetical protein